MHPLRDPYTLSLRTHHTAVTIALNGEWDKNSRPLLSIGDDIQDSNLDGNGVTAASPLSLV